MSTKTRIRRSPEERIATLDQKIIFHKEKIDLLEKQKKELLTPPKKKKTKDEVLSEIYKAAKASGKTLDDILIMLKKGEND